MGETTSRTSLWRIANALERIANRMDDDAKALDGMMVNGRTLSDRSAAAIETEELARLERKAARAGSSRA